MRSACPGLCRDVHALRCSNDSAQKDDPLRNVQAHSPHFFNSIKGDEGISTLRVLDGEGHVLDETDAGSKEIIDAIDREKAQRMYRAMTLTVR